MNPKFPQVGQICQQQKTKKLPRMGIQPKMCQNMTKWVRIGPKIAQN